MFKILLGLFLGLCVSCGRTGTVASPSPTVAPDNVQTSSPVTSSQTKPAARVPNLHDGDSFQNGDPSFPERKYQLRKYYWRHYYETGELNPDIDLIMPREKLTLPEYI